MKIINLLRIYGLTKYEAEVYYALVKIGRAKVQDLVKVTSVPRPMIYGALKKLANKGMCTENKGKVSHYSAVAPKVAFRDILQNEKEALQELNKAYKNQGKTEVPFEFIQVLKGKQIREFLKRPMKQAVKEVLIFCKYYTQKDENELENSDKLEIEALKKKIKIRCLYEANCLTDHNFLPHCKKALNAGEIGRVIDFLPMNMVIIDETSAAFSLSPKEERDLTVFLFNHPALILTLKSAFELYWSKGTDINKFLANI
jgi:sugar-specific transcriptional regulator TrmB